MQVMVTQSKCDVVAMGIKPTQSFEVLGPPVDEIPGAPQAIFIGVESDLRQQVLKRLKAALDIANDVGAHVEARNEKDASVGFFSLNV